MVQNDARLGLRDHAEGAGDAENPSRPVEPQSSSMEEVRKQVRAGSEPLYPQIAW